MRAPFRKAVGSTFAHPVATRKTAPQMLRSLRCFVVSTLLEFPQHG